MTFLNQDDIKDPETGDLLLLAGAEYDMDVIIQCVKDFGIDNLNGTLFFKG